MLSYLANFMAGVFLCNCIPHLSAGLKGELFPSPFSSPPGRGDSPPLANVIWGLANAVAGLLLLGFAPVTIGLELSFLLAVAGAFIGGALISRHFVRERLSRQSNEN